MSVEELTSTAAFDAALAANRVVIVDFFATWCGPCKVIKPHFVELAAATSGAKFVSVDVDQLEEVAARAEVRAMPTFMAFVDGKRAGKMEGAHRENLSAFVREYADGEAPGATPTSAAAAPAAAPAADDGGGGGGGGGLFGSIAAGISSVVAAVTGGSSDGVPPPAAAGAGGGGGGGAKIAHVAGSEQFEKLLADNAVVVVDFHAVWCGPCKKIAPTFAELASKTPHAAFVKVDVDECGAVAQKYNVTAMPTFMAFRDGKSVGEMKGANEAALRAFVAQHAGAPAPAAAAAAPAAAATATAAAPAAPAAAAAAAAAGGGGGGGGGGNGTVVNVANAAQFDALLAKTSVAVIDFSAAWCGPCKLIAPAFADIASKTPAAAASFGKVDVDECEDIAQKYNVTAMPTFMVFKDGAAVDTFKGANADALRAVVAKHVPAGASAPAAAGGAAATTPAVKLQPPAAGGAAEQKAAPAAPAAAPAGVVDVESAAQFDELLGANDVLIVDFSATWCGPCKLISPAFKEIAGATTGAAFAKVDVDECESIAQKYSVTAMPTFMAFKSGAKVAEFKGANESALREFVASHAASS